MLTYSYNISSLSHPAIPSPVHSILEAFSHAAIIAHRHSSNSHNHIKFLAKYPSRFK